MSWVKQGLYPDAALRSPTREAVYRSSGKYQARRLPGVHPEYNATTSVRGPNGRLTEASSFLPPVYSEAWDKGNAEVSLGPRSPPYGRSVGKGNAKDPQNTIVLLTGHGRHVGRKTNVVSQKQIK
ncbi:hypothetical protein TNCV_1358141 [Trichonephila clavipes]|uniref:Uncharacterized protein n=1 Tax=Trichonephila clavipes TaxID=2585209 RepID=A0A8X6VHW9_TRICX|nr:hypothetical protein TNCV_1358141 [Trichonephila clavipes]